jgi:hypothetical protein
VKINPALLRLLRRSATRRTPTFKSLDSDDLILADQNETVSTAIRVEIFGSHFDEITRRIDQIFLTAGHHDPKRHKRVLLFQFRDTGYDVAALGFRHFANHEPQQPFGFNR